jgi:hypothetical protein
MPWRHIGESILDLGTGWRWLVSFTFRLLYPPGKEPPAPIGQGSGLAPEPVWMLWKREKSLSCREPNPALQPIAIPSELSRHKETIGVILGHLKNDDRQGRETCPSAILSTNNPVGCYTFLYWSEASAVLTRRLSCGAVIIKEYEEERNRWVADKSLLHTERGLPSHRGATSDCRHSSSEASDPGNKLQLMPSPRGGRIPDQRVEALAYFLSDTVLIP